MTGLRRVSLAGLAVVAVATAAADARQPAPSQVTSRDRAGTGLVGSGVIEGRIVLGGDAPRPASHARVVARAAGIIVGGMAVADDLGRFTIQNLPAGTFTVTASRPGFVSGALGARRPGGAGTQLVVADGQRVTGVSIELIPAGAVAGVLSDEHGRPAPGIWVRSLQFQFSQGTRALVAVGEPVRSSSQGEFRLGELTPGEYYVMATGRERDAVGSATRVMSPEASKLADALLSAGRPGAAAELPPASQPGGVVVYAGSFFPGTNTAEHAIPVTVRSGETSQPVSFAVRHVTATTVTGIVSRVDGQSVANVELFCTPLGMRSPVGPPYHRAVVSANGEFAVPALPPGRYRLTARTARPSARGRATAAMSEERVLWASSEFDLRAEGVPPIALTLQPGATVSGRVVGAAGADIAGLRIQLVTPDLGFQSATSGQTIATLTGDTFSITNVKPGPYYLSVKWGGAAGSDVGPAGHALDDFLTPAGSVLDRRIDLEPGQALTDVQVVLAPGLSGVTGSLVDEQGSPAQHRIVLYPKDATLWFPQSSRIRSARIDTTGRFVLPVPPGAYYIAALEDLAEGEWMDPELLRRVQPMAIEVNVERGRLSQVTLKVR